MRSNNSAESGFIDLVLEFSGAATVLVIECKRVLDSKWVFLHSKGQINKRQRAKTWVSNYVDHKFKSFNWLDTASEPSCPECEFSIVWGQDNKSKPMLERVAASLVSSTGGICRGRGPTILILYRLQEQKKIQCLL